MACYKYYYNQINYGSIKYDNPSTLNKTETISSSGCGVCAVCMAINNLAGKELYTIPQMATFAINHKARDNSGTNVKTLLNALCKEVKGLSFTTTNDEATLVKHLKAGGMAVVNQGSSYNIFSGQGHFVTAIGTYNNDDSLVQCYDPYMYANKFAMYGRENRVYKATAYGAIVHTYHLNKATSDRSPAYYLITYKPTSGTTQPQTANTTKPTTSTPSKPVYNVGSNYKLTSDMNVRVGAGTNQRIKKVSELTTDGRKHATSTSLSSNAVLKAGTIVTATKVQNVGNDIWIQIPSGWIAVYHNGKKYANWYK